MYRHHIPVSLVQETLLFCSCFALACNGFVQECMPAVRYVMRVLLLFQAAAGLLSGSQNTAPTC